MSAESRNPVFLAELPFNPPFITNVGSVYTKDVAGITQLFFEDSAGGVSQLTGGGGAGITGGGVAGQVAFFTAATAIGGDTGLLWDSLTNALDVTAGLNPIRLGTQDAFARYQIWHQGDNSVIRLGADTADGDPSNIDSEGIVVYHPSAGDYLGRFKANRFALTRASDSSLNYFRVDDSSLFYRANPPGGTVWFNIDRGTGLSTFGGNITVPGALDNLLDIGTNATHRFRTGRFGTSVVIGASTTYADGLINSGSGEMVISAGSGAGLFTMSAFGGVAFTGSADIQFVTMGGIVQIESTANFALIKGITATVIGTGGIGLLASQVADVLLGPASQLVIPSDFAGNPNDDGVDFGSPANRFRTGRFGTSVVIGATTTYADGSITADGTLTLTAVGSVTISGVPLLPDADGTLPFGSAAFRWRNGYFSSFVSAPLLDMEESGGDPVAVANFGKLYTKDVAGVTELFFQRDDGTVLQLS